jgi:hypothetical protein
MAGKANKPALSGTGDEVTIKRVNIYEFCSKDYGDRISLPKKSCQQQQYR